MICPECKKIALIEKKVKGRDFTVDRCPQCNGTWFDKSEVVKVSSVAVTDLSVPDDADVEQILCPVCRKPLYGFYYPGTYVTIDMCKKCKGLWLDAEELKEIITVRKFHKVEGHDAQIDAQISQQAEQDDLDSIGGVRGGLLRFIDSAIENLVGGLW